MQGLGFRGPGFLSCVSRLGADAHDRDAQPRALFDERAHGFIACLMEQGSICTSVCFTITNMIQVCDKAHLSYILLRVKLAAFIMHARPGEISCKTLW